MSKAITTTYLGQPSFDSYDEVIITNNTAQFIADMLFKFNVCAARISVGRGTSYQMVFVHMHSARIYRREGGTTILPWTGGGDLYVGIERKTGFAFKLTGNLHYEYVAEKLLEDCDEIAENLATLINMIAQKKSSEFASNL